MESYEYQTLYELEGTYWWFQHLHAVLVDMIRSLAASSEPQILDAGCGTGQNVQNLVAKVSPKVFGFDLSPLANPFWRKRDLNRVCNASVNQIPFPENTFDFVVCVDVLESEGVSEELAVNEMRRVAKDGGYLILVVPAYDWLLTPEHHQAVHAIRRYTRPGLEALLARDKVQVRRITYMYTPVFPAIVLYRLILKALTRHAGDSPRSELKPLPTWINRILLAVTSLERNLLKHSDMPFGSSIVAIVQKTG